MKNFSSKDVRFSGITIKSCVGFIDLVDSTKNIATMDNLESIRRYYSTFINSISKIVKSYGGKVLKNIGDCMLVLSLTDSVIDSNIPLSSSFTSSVSSSLYEMFNLNSAPL